MPSDEIWNNNYVQFARMLAEIMATIELTDKQVEELSLTMDLTRDEIFEVFERAQDVFEREKQLMFNVDPRWTFGLGEGHSVIVDASTSPAGDDQCIQIIAKMDDKTRENFTAIFAMILNTDPRTAPAEAKGLL